MIQYYDHQPNLYETIRSLGTLTTVIRLDVQEMDSDQWKCDEIEYSHREPLTRAKDRALLIAAIIRSKYTSDAMEAILNNYLLSPTDTESKEEFEAMQAWRKCAKELADEVLAGV